MARVLRGDSFSLGQRTERSSSEIMSLRCLASSRVRWRNAWPRRQGSSLSELKAEIQRRAVRFLSARTTKHPAYDRFVAAQAAALELLGESKSAKAELARLIFEQVYQGEAKKPHANQPWMFCRVLKNGPSLPNCSSPNGRRCVTDLWPESEGETLRLGSESQSSGRRCWRRSLGSDTV